jgi:hypothetical protein
MPDHENTPETFWIPAHKEEVLKDQIFKFNRKAAKLDCPDLTYEVRGEKLVPAEGYEGEVDAPQVEMIEIELIGEAPKIDGWKFLGTLDHYSLPGKVIINTVPDESIPSKFHVADASCDHCGKVRRRNETFVLQEEDTGDYKRVGRQCVRDFIGYDPKAIARYMRNLTALKESFGDTERYSSGGTRFYTFEHINILAKTAAVIDAYGWVPRSASNEEHNATASHVMNLYFPPMDSKARKAWNEWRVSLQLDNPKWMEEAEAAREWLKQQSTDGEYWFNLHAINESNSVPTHLFGYWCSVMSGYQRAMEKLRLAEREHKVNDYVGEIKERRDFTVKLKSRRSFDSRYGTVRLHTFLDDEGHTLVWWANVDPDMELDGYYKIKGTIKAHDEYNDWKQTILTRVKVVEQIKQDTSNDNA